MPVRKFSPDKKLKYYGTDIWGTLLRTKRHNNVLKRLVVLNLISRNEDAQRDLLDVGIRYTSTELQKLSEEKGNRRFAKQLLRYEYRLIRNFYHSLSGKEWSLAWGLSRKMAGNWVDALLRITEGRVEYLFYRSGLLRSVYTGRAMLRSGWIQCYRGAELLSSPAPKSRMILRPGDVAHINFASKTHMWKDYNYHARLNALYFGDLFIRLPPSYLLVDFEGISFAMTDEIMTKDIRYPFHLPGDNYAKRLKAVLDAGYYYSKKRYRHKDYDAMFAQPAKLFDPAITNPYTKVSIAPRYDTTIPPLYTYGTKKNIINSKTYVLPFHNFPQEGIDRERVVKIPQTQGRIRNPPPANPMDLIKGGLKFPRIYTGPKLYHKYTKNAIAAALKFRG